MGLCAVAPEKAWLIEKLAVAGRVARTVLGRQLPALGFPGWCVRAWPHPHPCPGFGGQSGLSSDKTCPGNSHSQWVLAERGG